MEKLKINWIKATTTSTGKNKLDAEVIKEDGTRIDVSIWPDFPHYADLKPEEIIMAKIVGKDYKGKTYYSLAYDNPATGQTGGNKGGFIAKAQETKREDIKNAQENKELGIKISSTMRDAVLIVTTLVGQGVGVENIEEEIKSWRKKLWFMWDDPESYPPFNN